MSHRPSKNHKINHLHERCLRTFYCDKDFSCEEFLKDGSVMIHNETCNFNLRNTNEFIIRLLKNLCIGLESLLNLSRKVWNMLSDKYKEIEPLLVFKTKSKG